MQPSKKQQELLRSIEQAIELTDDNLMTYDDMLYIETVLNSLLNEVNKIKNS